MIKIPYPDLASKRSEFERSYLDAFNGTTISANLNTFWNNHANFAGVRDTLENILIKDIAALLTLSDDINGLATPAQIDELKRILNYDKAAYGKKFQPLISEFFKSNEHVNLRTCFFCNIDHINAFTDIRDYQGPDHFYRKASPQDLLAIDQIGISSVDKIKQGRANNMQIDAIGLNKTQLANMKAIKVKSRHSHFTLDHVLDKATHPIAALSLYNFVPCCYTCNSKLKGAKKLVTNAATVKLSPTASSFEFAEKVKFRILFPLDPQKKFHDILKKGDFILEYEIESGSDAYETLITLFKLRPRYVFHKEEALRLIRKRKRYSDTQMQELAKLAKVSYEQFKQDVFGEELFSKEYDLASFTKLKRDVAKDIGISGVL